MDIFTGIVAKRWSLHYLMRRHWNHTTVSKKDQSSLTVSLRSESAFVARSISAFQTYESLSIMGVQFPSSNFKRPLSHCWLIVDAFSCRWTCFLAANLIALNYWEHPKHKWTLVITFPQSRRGYVSIPTEASPSNSASLFFEAHWATAVCSVGSRVDQFAAAAALHFV